MAFQRRRYARVPATCSNPSARYPGIRRCSDTASTGTSVHKGASASAAADGPGWRRDAAVFLTSQTVSLFGSMIVQYAIMWHLTLVTKSGSVMALAAVFGFLPQALVSVFGGVLADRLNRKMLIIGADVVIATATLALALLMLAGATDLG